MENKLRAYIENIDGKMVAVATDETVDRHGDSLPIDAWDIRSFRKNPVLQFAHDYSSLPVGIAKNIRIDGKRMLFEPKFHGLTQLSKEVSTLYQEGVMKAFSVGFIPHTEGEKTRLELLEISAVPIPANPAAIVIEKAFSADKTNEIYQKQSVELWVHKEVEVITETKVFDEDEKEISFRVKNPDLFEKDSFETIDFKEEKPRIKAVMGILKGEENTTLQSLRFLKSQGWIMEDVRKWVESHRDALKSLNGMQTFANIEVKDVHESVALARVISELNFLINAFKRNQVSEKTTGKMSQALGLLLESMKDQAKVGKKELTIYTEKSEKGRSQADLHNLLETVSRQLGESNRRMRKNS